LFLGANIDAEKEAEDIEIDAAKAFNYEATKDGVQNMYIMASEIVTDKRYSSEKEGK